MEYEVCSINFRADLEHAVINVSVDEVWYSRVSLHHQIVCFVTKTNDRNVV